jgi:hypothetical protein
MEKNLVSLTNTQNPYQQSIIEAILREAEIPFTVRDGAAPTAYLGTVGPLTFQQFFVPPERLQEAKEILCANGVVCEVSPHLLSRSLEEIVKPLLASQERQLDRLARFVEINNKETVRALSEAVLKESGGCELLEELFFFLARNGSSVALRTLARSLHQKMNAGFGDRFQAELAHGEKKTRLALLEVLPELPPSRDRARALASALRDRDGEIREAASEALFGLGLKDFGYDPEDPPAEREAAVKEFLGWHGL